MLAFGAGNDERERPTVPECPVPARSWSRVVLPVLLTLVTLASGVARGDELASSLKKRVEEVLAGQRPLAEVRLEVVGGRPNRRGLIVYGSGVGIWNQEKQFALAPEELKELLRRTVAAGLFEMPERPRPERSAEPSPNAPVIVRAVAVRVGELERIVGQNDRVWTLPALEALVAELFGLCEKQASEGTGAATLTDGLQKIAQGKLAPETLQVILNIPPVAAGATERAMTGVIVVLDGGVLKWTDQAPGSAGVAVPVPVTGEGLRSLVSVLAGSGLEKLPVNLFRARYVDLNVRVLGSSRSVQARAFVGMDPAKHSAQQAALEKVIQAILALAPEGSGKTAEASRAGEPAGGGR
jgi:hypothetical protein